MHRCPKSASESNAGVSTTLMCFVILVFLLVLMIPTVSVYGSTAEGIPLRIQQIPPGNVILSGGLLSNRWVTMRDRTMPALWNILDGTNHSHFIENFRIAAGLSTNRLRGAPFNDGEVYKWIEGACAILAITKDTQLEQRLDDLIKLIEQVQLPDGYIHSQVIARMRSGDSNAIPFTDRNMFELYNFGHLFSAACIHYRVTGRTNLLNVAQKAAEYLYQRLQTGAPDALRGSVCPSHFMGLVDLFRATGQKRYLEIARELFRLKFEVTERGDDNQDRIPWLQQVEPVGHAVRANYLYAGAADLFLETADSNYWTPLVPIWSNLITRKLYITGGCGALYDGASPDGAKDQKSITRVHQAYGRSYQLPNITAHNETCASVGLVLWAWRMFQITGEAEYIDTLERALFNTVLAAVDWWGTNFLYVNPLRSTRVMPCGLRWPHYRQPFLGSFCCPPNLFRLLSAIGSYCYGIKDDKLYVTLYAANKLETEIAGGKLRLEQNTEYPWNGKVRLIVRETPPQAWSLMLRIPGWTRFGKGQVPIRINYRPYDVDLTLGKFIEIRRVWQAGDIVDLYLPMEAMLVEAHPLVEETFGQAAVVRGPIVYCAESIDLPPQRSVLDVILCPDQEMRAWYDRRFFSGIVVIDVPVMFRDSGLNNQKLYRPLEINTVPARPVRFVPYFIWGNRGTNEMNVWFPLALGRPGSG